ncbi:MAG: DUF4147 domain-containing protein [Chloroflexi bacterium]|nr:DUF4147 domain-containing protein [Chloroflexota bacterium]
MSFRSRLHSKTLDAHAQHLAIKKILSAALEAANPERAVNRVLNRSEGTLQINGYFYQLEHISNIYIIAVGKAAPAMASAARTILKDSLSGGVVVSKYPTEHELGKLCLYTAGHPLPDERSLVAGERILEFLSQTTEDDLVIFLISGGGSALITDPVEGVSLSDLKTLTSMLLGSGARIDEINIFRRALDRVKGGGLANAAYPAQIASLILSDVVDSPLEAIASGPTVPNPTTQADALSVLEKYNLIEQAPANIVAALQKKQGSEIKTKISVKNAFVIGSNRISAEAAKEKAMLEGFQTHVLTSSLQGEASQKGRELAALFRSVRQRPLCVIIGGETTVSLGDSSGYGGRNQEVALAAVETLGGLEDIMLITLATDGDDGPTDAAGAVVTGETLERANVLGLELSAHLLEHNAYPFFEALGDLLKPGPTGTNVNDLVFLFAF